MRKRVRRRIGRRFGRPSRRAGFNRKQRGGFRL